MEFSWSGNHRDRLLSLLETGFESDLTLIIGKNKDEVNVHKLILSMGSAFLHGLILSLKENEASLVFPDADVQVFLRLLQYLYSGELNINGVEEAIPLLQLSCDLEIKELIANCVKILEDNVDEDNILTIFQSAMKSGEKNLISEALEYICWNAHIILAQDAFTTLPIDCLVEILQQDNLEVLNEMEVFDALYRWGIKECSRLNLDAGDSSQMRTVLQKALKWIRFPLMEQTEFAMNVAQKDLIPMEHLVQILICFQLPVEQRQGLPEGQYSSISRKFVSLEEIQRREEEEERRQRENLEEQRKKIQNTNSSQNQNSSKPQLFIPSSEIAANPNHHEGFKKMFQNLTLID